MTEYIVHLEEWSHGLRCGLCSREMMEGEAYAEQLLSVIGDEPVVLIVCISCDLKAALV